MAVNREHESIIALYDNFAGAKNAIEALVAEGFDRTGISLIASDKDERYSTYIRQFEHENHDVDGEEGAGFGAVVGTLAGLGVALIPGLGQFVVAGAAGAALFAGIGAAAGAVTGGLTASLVDMGIDEDHVHTYTDRLRNDGALVIVHVEDEWDDRVETILKNHNPVNVEELD